MSTMQQRSKTKEQFWRAKVQQWRGSGQSVRAFCTKQRLSEPSFYAWRRTFARRDAATVQFAPVHIVPDPTSHTTAEGSTTGLELVLGRSRRLRIEPGFDGPTLLRLLELLEESRP